VSEAIAAKLAAATAEARAEWPEVDVADQDLLGYIAARLPDDLEMAAALDTLCVSDLYLACACARGSEAAIEAFQRGPLREVGAALRRYNPPGPVLDDIRQRVSELVLIGGADKQPKIGQYSGRGSLRAWIRVIAVREANRMRLADGRERPTEDDCLFDAATAHGEPEVSYLKASYRALFKQAFHDALAALSIHDRLLLRQHFLDGLSIDRLGALHGVHRATAARWLAGLRKKLLDKTHARLRAELQIDREELDSVMRLIGSHLEASIARVLAAK